MLKEEITSLPDYEDSLSHSRGPSKVEREAFASSALMQMHRCDCSQLVLKVFLWVSVTFRYHLLAKYQFTILHFASC